MTSVNYAAAVPRVYGVAKAKKNGLDYRLRSRGTYPMSRSGRYTSRESRSLCGRPQYYFSGPNYPFRGSIPFSLTGNSRSRGRCRRYSPSGRGRSE